MEIRCCEMENPEIPMCSKVLVLFRVSFKIFNLAIFYPQYLNIVSFILVGTQTQAGEKPQDEDYCICR